MNTYHFVYKTTNLINNRFYLGKHSTTNLKDGYLGSGHVLEKAIKKYGKKNFERKVLRFFNTDKEAYQYEFEIITKEILSDPLCYNLTTGGTGFSSGEAHSQFVRKLWQNKEFREKQLLRERKKICDPEILKKLSDAMLEVWKRPEFRNKISLSQSKAWVTPETRKNLLESTRNRNWVTDGKTENRIKNSDIFLKENLEWREGRLESPLRNTVNITNGIVNERLFEESLQPFLKENPDFYLGQTHTNYKKRKSTPNAGKQCVNNGINNRYVNDREKFLLENPTWRKGMVPRK